MIGEHIRPYHPPPKLKNFRKTQKLPEIHCYVTGPDVGVETVPVAPSDFKVRKQRVWQRKPKVDKSVQVPFLKPNNFHTIVQFKKTLVFQTISNRLTVPNSNSFGLSFVAETNRSALLIKSVLFSGDLAVATEMCKLPKRS